MHVHRGEDGSDGLDAVITFFHPGPTHLLETPHQPLGRRQEPVCPQHGARAPAEGRGGRGDGKVDRLAVPHDAAVLGKTRRDKTEREGGLSQF